jgi:DNA-binding transcriptional LysR family regulator
VRIQTSPTLSGEVGALIARYAASHPQTTFDLTAANQMGDLLGERIDLALRDDPAPESSLIVRRLASAEWTPCASLDHVARRGVPVHPIDLADHNCLVYVCGHDSGEWRFTGGGGGQAVRVSGDLRSSDPHALRAAALAGQGVVLLPDAMVSEDLRTGRLVRVLSGYSAESATVRAIYPSRRHLPMKVRTFLDFVAGAFAGPRQIELTGVGVSTGRAEFCDEPPKGTRLSSVRDDRSPPTGLAGRIGGRDFVVTRTLKASGAGQRAAAL